MKAQELINKVRDIAINYDTLYVYGCFGAPMNESNKYRYTHNYPYNEQPERSSKIWNASYNTFGFDCVNLIKGVLWGWYGDVNATYGGAVYGSNGVPDTNANGMFWDYCYNQSDDFSNIEPGEFVWMEGHIGVYIGDGYVVECTPIWNDGVMITYLGNWGWKEGYASRTWSSHGKSNFVDYTQAPAPQPEPTPEPAPEPTPDGLKIGDYVKIVGEGNGSSYGDSNIAVPGYEGTITNIYEGRPFPYEVSDYEGVLGYYPASSLEKA